MCFNTRTESDICFPTLHFDMATRSHAVCELLCYMANKFGKFDNKKLCSIISDFYSPAKTSEVKDFLVKEVESLNLTETWPQPFRRRDSDLGARSTKHVQDILMSGNPSAA